MTNTSRVRRPKWTGRFGEFAVVVSRGEPRRTNDEMQHWINDQLSAYLAAHVEGIDAKTADAVVQLVMADHVWPIGKQGVMLSREHVLAYARKAMTERDN